MHVGCAHGKHIIQTRTERYNVCTVRMYIYIYICAYIHVLPHLKSCFTARAVLESMVQDAAQSTVKFSYPFSEMSHVHSNLLYIHIAESQ